MYKRVEESIHMLRIPKSWAVQRQIMDYHTGQGDIKAIRIEAIDTSKTYESSLAHFMKFCDMIDRGDSGEQYILAYNRWTITDSKSPQLKMQL